MPRQVLPGTTYMLTRRTILRQFLLRPSKLCNQIFLYCLGVAAQRYGVLLHSLVVMSNHYHPVVTDEQGKVPEFERWLNEFVAKAVNASLGRWEALWAPGSYNAVTLETSEDVLDAMTYTATNPVKAVLVERSDLWPGINILPSDLGRKIKVRRPPIFFRADGPLPDEVELEFVKPAGFQHLSLEEFQAQWQQRIDVKEAQLRSEVAASGRSFRGRRRVKQQDPFTSATSHEQRRGLKPRVKCRDKRLRLAAIQRIQRFCREHRAAFEQFKAGIRDVLFPAGTYWMRVHANVRCAPG